MAYLTGAYSRYADGDHLRLVNLGAVAPISEQSLNTSRCKGKEGNDIAHFLFILYILKSRSKDSDDLLIGFHRHNTTQVRELKNNKTTKETYNGGISVSGHPPGNDDAVIGARAGRVVIEVFC